MRRYGWLGQWGGGTGAVASLPQTGSIVFEHDLFDGNTTAQVGSYTYTRTGTVNVMNSSGVVTAKGANTIPLSRPYDATENFDGMWVGGSIKNWLLYSEDFSHATWVKSGLTVTADAVAAPDGTTTADKLNSASGSTITQDTGTAPSSYGFVGSVWMRTVTGTATVQLLIFDGGSQKAFLDCPVTTTWKRFQIPKKFDSGTSTGTVSFRIKTSSDIYVWGAQVERFTHTNTLGARDRYGIANPYVKTTTAVADTGNSSYVIPNSVVTAIANTGSLQMWVYPEHDCFDSGSEILFSVNAEQFALYINNGKLSWYWNNSVIASTPDATSFMRWFQPYAWNHLCLTWNTTTDEYDIYINGVDVTGTTTTASNLTTSTYTMTIGGYNPTNFPYIAADVWVSQVVIWSVKLSASEVLDALAVKSGVALRSEPGNDLLFEVDLATSLVPTTGDTEYYYSPRGYGTWYYPDSTTTLAPIAWDAKPTAYPLNGGTYAGLPFNSNGQNLILQSENIGTTWSSITGSPTITANVGTFLGTLSYGTILGVSGEGIKQAITNTSTDKWTGSVFASVASGTLAARLSLIRDGTETISQNITLTTTPTRFSVYADFTSNPGTGVEFQFLLQASGTARVGGFQLEPCVTGTRALFNKIGSPYQKTTTTASNVGWSFPVYRAKDSIKATKGTFIAWGFLDENPNTDHLPSNGPVLLAMPGQGKNIYYNVAPDQNTVQAHNVSNAGLETPFSLTPRTWTHFAMTWDFNSSTSQITIKMYLNGSEIDSRTSNSATNFLPGKFTVGADFVYGLMDYWSGALGQIRIYGEAKDATFVLSDYNGSKADYGL